MVIAAIQALARDLPRFAEEGADCEVLSEEHLGNRLIGIAGGHHAAMAIVAMARQSLRLAGCLDERELAAAKWRFVSFPAYLFARSLLETLASGHPRVLEAGFWDPSESRIQAQRDLLRTFEGVRLAAPGCVRPIRRVWVAWAAIACDGSFLLVRREDTKPLRPGSMGEFVLPGGRSSPVDLPPTLADDHLRFFDPYVPVADLSDVESTLERTLRRELSEELALDAGSLRAVTPSGPRIVYTALEGANSAHAITEYMIQLYKLELHPTGEERLLRRLAAMSQQFAWFTHAELIRQKNELDQSAFIKALIDLPSAGRDRVLDPSACELCVGGTRMALADSEELVVPCTSDSTMAIGRKGRERHVIHGMDDSECALLGFLAAVRRGFKVSNLHSAVHIVPRLGWVVFDDSELIQPLRSLNMRLTAALRQKQRQVSTEWTPLAFAGNAVRVNVRHPDDVCLASEAFSLVIRDEVPGKSFRLRLVRRAISCVLGVADEEAREDVVPFILGTALSELAQGRMSYARDNLESWKRDQREVGLASSLGLKLLARVVDGKPTLCVAEARVL